MEHPGDKCYVNDKEMRRDKFDNCSVFFPFGERYNKRTFGCEYCRLPGSNNIEQHFRPRCIP